MQMALAQDKDVVQALTSDATKEALDDGVGAGRSDRRADDPDPARPGHARKCWAELGIIVADQELRLLAVRCGLP